MVSLLEGQKATTARIPLSPEEMMEVGREWGSRFESNSVVALQGELGVGKTTFVKGIVEGATGLPANSVQSPTFTYLSRYEGTKTVYHFDLYRLPSAEEFIHMGFDEYFSAGGICCIEWPEKIESLLPTVRRYTLLFEALTKTTRRIVFFKSSEKNA